MPLQPRSCQQQVPNHQLRLGDASLSAELPLMVENMHCLSRPESVLQLPRWLPGTQYASGNQLLQLAHTNLSPGRRRIRRSRRRRSVFDVWSGAPVLLFTSSAVMSHGREQTGLLKKTPGAPASKQNLGCTGCVGIAGSQVPHGLTGFAGQNECRTPAVVHHAPFHSRAQHTVPLAVPRGRSRHRSSHRFRPQTLSPHWHSLLSGSARWSVDVGRFVRIGCGVLAGRYH